MAIQAVKGGMFFPDIPVGISAGPGFSTTTLLIDAASEKAALLFQAPKAGNIRKVLWRTATVTTGATLDVRLETVAAGAPSGTLVATNTNGAQVVADSDDNAMFATQLTADCAVARGTTYALVIANPAVSFGNMQIAAFIDNLADFPRTMLYTASWASAGNQLTLVVGFEYDDGTYDWVPSHWCMSTIVSTTFGSGTNPNHRALRASLPFKCRVSGARIWIDANNDFTAKLFDSDGSTVLASTAVTAANTAAASQPVSVLFSSSVTLNINTVYRLAIVPDGAGTVILYEFTVPSAAALDAAAGGQALHLSTCNGAPANDAAWTQTTTQRPFIQWIIDGLDDGVSAGGGGARIIGG